MSVYLCISGDNFTYHSSVDDVITNIRVMTSGDTSYDDIIRSLTPGSTCDIGETNKVNYISYAMANTLTFELSSVVEPVPTISTVTYTYISTDEEPSISALLSSETPVDLSSVYYDFIAS